MAEKLYVKNECVDRRDGTPGKRYFPGDTFPNPTDQAGEDEVARLTKANCLTTDKAEAPDPPAADAAVPAKAPAGSRRTRQAQAG